MISATFIYSKMIYSSQTAYFSLVGLQYVILLLDALVETPLNVHTNFESSNRDFRVCIHTYLQFLTTKSIDEFVQQLVWICVSTEKKIKFQTVVFYMWRTKSTRNRSIVLRILSDWTNPSQVRLGYGWAKIEHEHEHEHFNIQVNCSEIMT